MLSLRRLGLEGVQVSQSQGSSQVFAEYACVCRVGGRVGGFAPIAAIVSGTMDYSFVLAKQWHFNSTLISNPRVALAFDVCAPT
jgi:hypothetical protein